VSVSAHCLADDGAESLQKRPTETPKDAVRKEAFRRSSIATGMRSKRKETQRFVADCRLTVKLYPCHVHEDDNPFVAMRGESSWECSIAREGLV